MSEQIRKLNRRRFIGLAGLSVLPPLSILASTATNNDLGNDLYLNLNPPAENKIATVFETKIICREPGKFFGTQTDYGLNINGHLIVKKAVIEPDRYLGWPTITKADNNELIVAFSGDRDAHVCPWGKTQLIKTTDNGKTWSEPETITNTPLDDRDAGIITTQKGTLLVSWFTSIAFERSNFEGAYNRYARVGEKIGQETKNKWLGSWVRRSEDRGKTWQNPIPVKVTAPHGPIALNDGRLLYLGRNMLKRGNEEYFYVQESIDDGKTWKILAALPTAGITTKHLQEPHMVQLNSGKIIGMFRYQPEKEEDHIMMQTESYDGGKTWSLLHTTGILGYPPHIIQLKNNWLLVVYGRRIKPYGERACISKDEGETWDVRNEITLCNADSRDLGYPSSVQLSDGSILTIYYQAEKVGSPACLWSTHWRLT